MNGQTFKAGFLDAGGALIRIVPMPASTVTAAAQLAEKLATEIHAADFFLTATPVPPERATCTPLPD